LLKDIIDKLDDDTLLITLGDHGQLISGTHGGRTKQ